jgi:hypothetical protein
MIDKMLITLRNDPNKEMIKNEKIIKSEKWFDFVYI